MKKLILLIALLIVGGNTLAKNKDLKKWVEEYQIIKIADDNEKIYFLMNKFTKDFLNYKRIRLLTVFKEDRSIGVSIGILDCDGLRFKDLKFTIDGTNWKNFPEQKWNILDIDSPAMKIFKIVCPK